jgi:hypothetical protein
VQICCLPSAFHVLLFMLRLTVYTHCGYYLYKHNGMEKISVKVKYSSVKNVTGSSSKMAIHVYQTNDTKW